MAGEPSPVAASPAAANERDILLATKLNVPPPVPGMVHRPRLAERLAEGLAQGLVLVCAPAGYGKTVLLADCVRRARRRAAWLSLDHDDDDPGRFWRYTVAALDHARPGIGERVGPLLGPAAAPSMEPLVTALINELATAADGEEVLLVLDDYHVIDSRSVHEQVGFLLEHRPPALRVVLASRTDPPLALARLRARSQLTELRVADLRFTADESGGLLAHVASDALPVAAVAALTERTEGWAAGLQLAGLSLRGQPDVDRFVAAFTGSNRYVLDFLAEEVLERQSESVRTFLLETSVLERLSAELCDAVTGRTGSQALLEYAEGAGLFLVPLDEVRAWWRYHHLFADLLRARLRTEQPARVVQLHHNAAAWCAEHGLADDAIRHAAAAGEMTWAARLIEQHFDAAFYLRGEHATIRRWISEVPDELARSRPRLLVAQSFLAAYGGQTEAVEELINTAERAYPGTDDDRFEPAGGRSASLLVNVPAAITLYRSFVAEQRGDAEGTVALASRALGETREDERLLRCAARANLAVAEWLRGRLSHAEQAFVSAIADWSDPGHLTLTAGHGHHLGQVQRAQGRLDAAARTYQRALEITAPNGSPVAPTAGFAHMGLAEVAYQRNDLDSALRHVTDGVALCRPFAHTAPLAAGLATLAWIRQVTGDPAGARGAIEEAQRVAPGPPGLMNPVPAQRVRLLLAQGDLPEASRWTHESGLDPQDTLSYPREPGHLVLARVLLAQGRAGEAVALLERLNTAAAAQGRTGSLIEIGAIRALALAALGDQAAAVAVLAGALELACPQGYVRVFADEGQPMASLLGQLITAQREDPVAAVVPLDYLARLQRAFVAGPQTTARATVTAPGIVEPLTSRELEVLRMLAAGRANKAIARELVVSPDTVKTHVRHVLGKLGAANRTEAVARARQLELI